MTFCVRTWKAARYMAEQFMGLTMFMGVLMVGLWLIGMVVAVIAGLDSLTPVVIAMCALSVFAMAALIMIPVSLLTMWISGYVAQKLVS